MVGSNGPHRRLRRSASASLRVTVLAVVAGLVVGACAAPVPPPSTGATSPDPATLGYEFEFRALYGLRRDPDYIWAVAENPASAVGVRECGVPLMPAEVLELKARASNTAQVFSVVETYGERHPNDWAGIFVDNAGSGAVVAQFSGNVADHAAAIRALVGPAARVEVRGVRWSSAALSRAADSIRADEAWFRTIDASLAWAEVSEIENRVDVSISSTNPDAVALTVDHFAGDGWLHAVSDGIGDWQGGVGRLVVRLLDAAGRPVGGTGDDQWLCRLEPDDPAAWRGGSLLMVNGRCESPEPLGATTYAVTVTRDDGSGEIRVAAGRIKVVADRTVELRLTAPGEGSSPMGSVSAVRRGVARRDRARRRAQTSLRKTQAL